MKFSYLLILIVFLPVWLSAQETDDIAGILIGDEPTSQTIIGAQSLTETRLAEIRLTMNRQSNPIMMTANLEQMTTALGQFIEVTEVRLPEQEKLLRSLGGRSQTLLNNLQADYIDENYQQADVTFQLLSRTWEEMKSIPAAANITGLQTTSSLIPEPPSDWDQSAEQVGFGSRWTLRTGEEISTVLRSRLYTTLDASEIKLKEENLENAREIKELSRLLRARTGELPALSRKGFLDHALQLEVISDNLEYFYNEGNQLAFRRQLKLAIESIDGLREYYSVRNSAE